MYQPDDGWVLPPAPPTKDDVIAVLHVQIEMLREREARLVAALFFANPRYSVVICRVCETTVLEDGQSREHDEECQVRPYVTVEMAQQALAVAARPDAGGEGQG